MDAIVKDAIDEAMLEICHLPHFRGITRFERDGKTGLYLTCESVRTADRAVMAIGRRCDMVVIEYRKEED